MTRKASRKMLFRTLVLVLGLLFAIGVVRAEGVKTGAGCSVQWQAGAGGGPVDGFRVYVGATSTLKEQQAEVGAGVFSVPCSNLTLTEGQNYLHITAFNLAGEVRSATIPFEYISRLPAAPINVTIGK